MDASLRQDPFLGGHLSKADISGWLVLAKFHACHSCLHLNSLYKGDISLYKGDISLRQKARHGPEGVWLRESSLYNNKEIASVSSG